MYKRLYSHLECHKVLYNYQFGFRKNHGTNLALMEVIDSIYKSLDSSKIVCGVFLDLQKAFDTVQHDILLNKLFNYGISLPPELLLLAQICTKSFVGWGFAPDPTGELTALPQTP